MAEKPTTVDALAEYLRAHPRVRQVEGPSAHDGPFDVYVRDGVLYRNGTATYATLGGVAFDAAGFTITGFYGNRIRYEYAEGDDADDEKG